jgi:hydrogenase/urease accessory protein HupE
MIKSLLKISYCCIISALFLLLPFQEKAEAHAYSASYTTLILTKSQIEMTYALDELSVIELTGSDVNKNGMLDQEEFDKEKSMMESQIKEKVVLKINGESQQWTHVESYVLDRKGDATKVILKVIFPPVAASQSINLTDSLYEGDAKTNYVNLLTIQYGEQKSTAALSGNDRSWVMMVNEAEYAGFQQDIQQNPVEPVANSQDNAVKNETVSSGWYSFFKLGMNHILTGYDHLLFLFTLLIARQTFKQYATMITAFTVAHSISLSLTVLGLINVSPSIVEPAIAISICYVAFDNILHKNVKKRWVLTFLFGLIHGMGFADILKEMNIPKSNLAIDLISFNVGIETVQVSLVLVLLPLLILMHRWKLSRYAVVTGSSVGLLLGGIWLIQRLV